MKTQFAVLRSKGAKLAAAVTALAVTNVASAAVASADIIDEISSNSTAIVAIGGAILVVLAIVAGISHTRRVVR